MRDEMTRQYEDAKRFFESPAWNSMTEEFRITMYQRWVNESNGDARERLNNIAVAGETLFNILIAWGEKAKSMDEALTEFEQSQIEAVR